MNNSSTDQSENIDHAIQLNREIASRIASLKRKCFDFKIQGPIQLSQRSNKNDIPSTSSSIPICQLLKFPFQEQDVLIKQLSCRLNIQGLTIEQFFTGRVEITESELIIILINKLKYPNQYTARKTARFIFQMTICDLEQKRQIDDILFEFKKRVECSSYSRSTGKQLFQKLKSKIRNLFYLKMINKSQINYQAMSNFLFSEGLDLYQINQLLSYILECSTASSFLWLQLKPILLKQQPIDGEKQKEKKDKYEKKESILTKSSEDLDTGYHVLLKNTKREEQISFIDCQIEIVEPLHETHRCGIYNYVK